MRLISCHLENFQSYPKLDIEFKDGLALISGPTGVGKSTVMDAVAWCLYGVTAKQTTSDQVIPWGESGRTTGIINLQGLSIFRGRSPNFLHYNDGKKGKDLKETQEFINRELGIDYDTFVAGSYFNATSPVSDFFLAKAKERRELFEKLTDLSFPDLVKEKATDSLKNAKAKRDLTASAISNMKAKLDSAVNSLHRAVDQQENWEKDRAKRLVELEETSRVFAYDRENKILSFQRQIESFTPRDQEYCPTCNNSVGLASNSHQLDHFQKELSRIQGRENAAQISFNILIDQKLNPYDSEQEYYITIVETAEIKLKEFQKDLDKAYLKITTLETIHQLASVVRASMLENVIKQVQILTNSNLIKFFDAELTVSLEVEVDNLNVVIHKGQHECSFKQLSKGQKQLLKLCFGVAVMEVVSETSGVKFENLFFDEALDGLDPNLKVKSYPLFQTLLTNHSSILVIEHAPEFQSLFDTVYNVISENGKSSLSYE